MFHDITFPEIKYFITLGLYFYYSICLRRSYQAFTLLRRIRLDSHCLLRYCSCTVTRYPVVLLPHHPVTLSSCCRIIPLPCRRITLLPLRCPIIRLFRCSIACLVLPVSAFRRLACACATPCSSHTSPGSGCPSCPSPWFSPCHHWCSVLRDVVGSFGLFPLSHPWH